MAVKQAQDSLELLRRERLWSEVFRRRRLHWRLHKRFDIQLASLSSRFELVFFLFFSGISFVVYLLSNSIWIYLIFFRRSVLLIILLRSIVHLIVAALKSASPAIIRAVSYMDSPTLLLSISVVSFPRPSTITETNSQSSATAATA